MSVGYAYPPSYPGAGMMVAGGPIAGMQAQTVQSGGAYSSMYGSFAFKKRFEAIDWKKVASCDVDNIARNLDFHALQENIANVTFCNIEAEVDLHSIDPNFIKLFKLAQLTIEYLLHSQDYLSTMVGSLESKLKKSSEESEASKKGVADAKAEVSELKKECHKRKKMLIAQQQMLQAGANSYNKCPYCTKAFVNATFLQSHLARRHSELLSQFSLVGSQMAPPAASQHEPPQQAPANDHERAELMERNAQVERELQQIKDRLLLTESQLDEERHARNEREEREHDRELKQFEKKQRELERIREEDERRHEEQMHHVEASFQQQLREMEEKYEVKGEQLEAILRKQKLGGDAETERERDLLQQQRAEIAMLKEQLQEQVESSERREKNFDAKLKSIEHEQKLKIEESLRHDVRVSMEMPSDDDMTTSLRTMQGTGSLSLSATRQAQLMERIRQNPEFLKGMRAQLQGVFEDLLDKRGVPRHVKSMTSSDFMHKMAILKQERVQKASKLPNFWDIRQQYHTEVEQLARQKLDKQRADEKAVGRQSARGSSLSSSLPLPGARSQSAAAAPRNQRDVPSSRAPQRSQSAPRASSPPLKKPTTTTMHARAPPPQTGSGQPRARPRTPKEGAGARGSNDFSREETITSGQWASSDESDVTSEDDDDDVTDEPTNGNHVRGGARSPSAAKPMPSPRRNTSAPTKKVTLVEKPTSSSTFAEAKRRAEAKVALEDDDESDDWDDDISGLDDELEPRTSTARQSPSPRAPGTVSRLRDKLERKLSAPRGEKPAGAVDVAPAKKVVRPTASNLDDYDDSLTDISDQGDAGAHRRSGVGARSTDVSSNTYNTSAWAPSSKALQSVGSAPSTPPRLPRPQSLPSSPHFQAAASGAVTSRPSVLRRSSSCDVSKSVRFAESLEASSERRDDVGSTAGARKPPRSPQTKSFSSVARSPQKQVRSANSNWKSVDVDDDDIDALLDECDDVIGRSDNCRGDGRNYNFCNNRNNNKNNNNNNSSSTEDDANDSSSESDSDEREFYMNAPDLVDEAASSSRTSSSSTSQDSSNNNNNNKSSSSSSGGDADSASDEADSSASSSSESDKASSRKASKKLPPNRGRCVPSSRPVRPVKQKARKTVVAQEPVSQCNSVARKTKPRRTVVSRKLNNKNNNALAQKSKGRREANQNCNNRRTRKTTSRGDSNAMQVPDLSVHFRAGSPNNPPPHHAAYSLTARSDMATVDTPRTILDLQRDQAEAREKRQAHLRKLHSEREERARLRRMPSHERRLIESGRPAVSGVTTYLARSLTSTVPPHLQRQLDQNDSNASSPEELTGVRAASSPQKMVRISQHGFSRMTSMADAGYLKPKKRDNRADDQRMPRPSRPRSARQRRMARSSLSRETASSHARLVAIKADRAALKKPDPGLTSASRNSLGRSSHSIANISGTQREDNSMTRKKTISSHSHMSSLRAAAASNSRSTRKKIDKDDLEVLKGPQTTARWYHALTKGDRGRKHRGGTSQHDTSRPSLRELTIALERTQVMQDALPSRIPSTPGYYNHLRGMSFSATPASVSTLASSRMSALQRSQMNAQARSSFMAANSFERLRESRVNEVRRNRVHALRLGTMRGRVADFALPAKAQKRHALLQKEEDEQFVDTDGLDTRLRLFLNIQSEREKEKEQEKMRQLQAMQENRPDI